MTHRLITAVCKVDRNRKRALFSGNFNIFSQPKRLELRQFLSQLSSHPPKGFDKPLNQNNGNKSGACSAGAIGADRKSSSLSGGADGRGGDGQKSKGGLGSDGKNKTRIFIGTASILGVCWVYLNQKDFNWMGAVDNFLSKSTVECESALAIPDGKSKPDETLQKGPNAIYQETTDGETEKESDPGDLAQLVNSAKSTDPQIQCGAVNSLRKLLTSSRNPPIDALISCNILPTLVDCLSSPNPALQFDASRALAEIVAGTSQQTQAVVEAGAVQYFLRLLTSPDLNVRENALSALASIITDGPQLRDCVINLGLVAPLLNCIQPDTSITFLQQVAAVIAKLCIYMDPPPPHKTVLEILPALNALVHHNDPMVLFLAAWALMRLIEGGKEQTQMVIDSGVIPKLVQLLNYREDGVKMVAARAVGTIIVTATHAQAQAVLKCVAPSHLNNLLEHPNKTICNIALLVLAMCVGENFATVQAVIDAGLIPLIFHHLEKGELQTQNSAVHALTTMIVRANKQEVANLMDCGVIPPLCNLLNSKDSEVQEVALKAVCNIFTRTETNDQVQAVLNCDALSHFHNLLKHPERNICTMALCVLTYVTARSVTQVQTVIDAGLIPLIIHNLGKGEFLAQKAAALALSTTAASGNKEQVAHLIDCGVISPFCNLLNCEDSEVVQIVLDGIHNILAKLSVDQGDGDKAWTLIKECGGLDKIKTLQNHENMEISKIAYKITLMGSFSDDYVTIR